MPLKFAVFLIAALFACQPACADDSEWREYLGTPELEKINGVEIWTLAQGAGDRVKIATPQALAKLNPRTGECLKQAAANNQSARLAGILNGSGKDAIHDIQTLVCAPVRNQAECPRHIIATKTIEGIYQGVICGDSCYLTLKLANGEDFSTYADEEEVVKLFGEEPGKKVSITYNIVELWNPESFSSDDPYQHGVCSREESFVSGKILNK